MAAAPRDPQRQADAIKAKLRTRMDKVVQGMALEAHKRLALRTPVDSGRARANWHLGSGAPSTERTEVSEGVRGKRGSASRASSVASAAFGAARQAAQTLTANTKAFITNNLPYIRRLEYGWSKQAPNGMVRVTVEELKQMFPQIVRQAKASDQSGVE